MKNSVMYQVVLLLPTLPGLLQKHEKCQESLVKFKMNAQLNMKPAKNLKTSSTVNVDINSRVFFLSFTIGFP